MAARQRWVVYVLRCADGSLYTGIARDLARRLAEHNAGSGAKYTRARLPVVVVHQEIRMSRGAALRREHEIKRLSRGGKLALSASVRHDAAVVCEPGHAHDH